MIGCFFITNADSSTVEPPATPPIVLFGYFQQKLNFISLEGRHGVASLQSVNQSNLTLPSPLRAYRYPQVFLTGGTAFPGCAKILAQARKPVSPKNLLNQPLFDLWVMLSL
jgi:hypothetical protein